MPTHGFRQTGVCLTEVEQSVGDRDHIEDEENDRRRKQFSPQVRDVPTDLRLLDKVEDLEV